MPYPYSWTPEHVVPTNANQVTVTNRADGAPATLSTAVSVSSGTVSFATTNPGSYVVNVSEAGRSTSKHFSVNTNSAASTPVVAAGANAGTTPPAPALDAGSTDLKGRVRFGTGATPAAGAMVTVTFSNPVSSTPLVYATLSTAGGAAVSVSNVSTTGFTINFLTAPTASQALGTYAVTYKVEV